MKAPEKKKTFSIKLGHPFGRSSYFYTFNIHAEAQEEAARWVEQVFPGVDAQIVDCDSLKKHKVVNGVRVEAEVPHGNFRATNHRVLKELHEIYKKLTDDLNLARASVYYWKNKTDAQGITEKDRLQFIKTSTQNLKKATTWSHRLLGEIAKLQELGYE
jgi:hypothetical protein